MGGRGGAEAAARSRRIMGHTGRTPFHMLRISIAYTTAPQRTLSRVIAVQVTSSREMKRAMKPHTFEIV